MTARSGDWTCHQHGVITPDRTGCVPSCPRCGAMVELVRRHPAGYLEHVQPHPSHCAGPGRHLFGPGTYTISAQGCGCPAVRRAATRAHTVWWCSGCLDRQVWPPHEG